MTSAGSSHEAPEEPFRAFPKDFPRRPRSARWRPTAIPIAIMPRIPSRRLDLGPALVSTPEDLHPRRLDLGPALRCTPEYLHPYLENVDSDDGYILGLLVGHTVDSTILDHYQMMGLYSGLDTSDLPIVDPRTDPSEIYKSLGDDGDSSSEDDEEPIYFVWNVHYEDRKRQRTTSNGQKWLWEETIHPKILCDKLGDQVAVKSKLFQEQKLSVAVETESPHLSSGSASTSREKSVVVRYSLVEYSWKTDWDKERKELTESTATTSFARICELSRTVREA